MELKLYHVDAFADRQFTGNPAAVVPLPHWLPAQTMQNIAAENALSETAFFVGGDGRYELRWFTPEHEIDLCGHATLATAFVICTRLEPRLTRLSFQTKSGELTVERRGERYVLNFPARPGKRLAHDEIVARALGKGPLELYLARDYVAVFESEDDIRALKPDLALLSTLNDGLGFVVTAPGSDCDFVSRAFFPKEGIPEDPVTGSTHCTLVPYWAARLGKRELHARQLSRRGGELFCRDNGSSVEIAGTAVRYMEGSITIP